MEYVLFQMRALLNARCVKSELLINLAGLKPNEDIDIVFTGLKPGEKLSEELHFDTENFVPTKYDKLLVMKQQSHVPHLPDGLDSFLNSVIHLSSQELITQLMKLVPEYRPSPSHMKNQFTHNFGDAENR